MRIYAQRGIDYETVLDEIEAQRPFNTGATEAQQIRDRSHPLFAVEMAVSSLSGLPDSFVGQIETLATEFQIEYTVLVNIDDGLNDIQVIREQVSSNVRALDSDSDEAINDTINWLCKKQILTRDGEIVQLA